MFVFHRFPFGVDDIQFVNDLAGNLPATGFNVAVVQDGNPPSGAAGAAANLIAAQLTTPGPGFFIYFNTGLNLPRLVDPQPTSMTTPQTSRFSRRSRT